jgi:hypothetical protein
MTVNELLIDRNLTSALIIDDAYDNQPLAKDLVGDEEAWNTFIADIQAEHEAIIEAFPAYDDMSSAQLRTSDEFVAAVWRAKGKISEENWNTLFDDYVRATAGDRTFLNALEEQLRALGITCTTSGRQLAQEANQVPLIFADLFLGATQEAHDVDESVSKLQTILRGRENDPPVVILMSRSERLNDRKADFRDKAGLLGALFRVSSKNDLIAGSNLEKILRRMAQHRPDALRVARFLKSWEDGLNKARREFMISIRRLDLSDYVQVRQVLLNFEGQPLGSYLLDVFDRVLQYEIEGDTNTISAAEDVNNIDSESYAVPYIAQSSDLQHLVYRTIIQNPERLKVRATDCGAAVGFGDLLVRAQGIPGEPEAKEGRPVEGAACKADAVKEELPDALLVLTPACDLVREGGASRVLLMAGSTFPLDPRSWNYKESAAPKTPILEIDETHRVWIKWNVKDLRMMAPNEIAHWLKEGGDYRVVARLRESNALEIQQKVLSSMGRIGLLAPMPATFEVDVRAYYQGADGMPHDYEVPVLVKEGGVCFVGRDEDGKENTRLILTEQAIDDLMAAIGRLETDVVVTAARRNFEALRASKSFENDVQRGLQVPPGSAYKAISCVRENAGNVKSADVVGAIVRNPAQGSTPSASHACLVIVLTDKVTASAA